MTTQRPRILVVGDLIVDRYSYVTTERMSAEAPGIPVWNEIRSEQRLGGAANVANNIASLISDQPADVWLAGVCLDPSIERVLARRGIGSLLSSFGETIVKHRYVGPDGRYVMRVDNVKRLSDDTREMFGEYFISTMALQAPFDLVVVSDYDIGTVVPEVDAVVRELNCPVIVDSKRRDLSGFRGCFMLKVNESEHAVQIAQRAYPCVESLFRHVVVTHGGLGAELRTCSSLVDNVYRIDGEAFPVQRQDVVDVTGCGDTFVAGLAYYLALKGRDVRSAVKFANVCASKVVGIFGTGVVEPTGV